jgi:hypothetical protein
MDRFFPANPHSLASLVLSKELNEVPVVVPEYKAAHSHFLIFKYSRLDTSG